MCFVPWVATAQITKQLVKRTHKTNVFVRVYVADNAQFARDPVCCGVVEEALPSSGLQCRETRGGGSGL